MQTFNVQKEDGSSITATAFSPHQPNGTVILIASATAVKQTYYYPFAAYCAEQGYWVYTLDFSGIGLSKEQDLRASRTDYLTWAREDFPALIEYATIKHPEMPLVIVGHSSGGHCLGMSEATNQAAGIIMIGSQQGYWRNYALWKGVLVWLAFRVSIPLLTKVFGYFPSHLHGLGEPLPKGVVRDWQRVVLRPQGVEGLVPYSSSVYRRLKKKMLFISIDDDLLASKRSTDRLANELFEGASVERLHIFPQDVGSKAIGHFGFFRKAFRDSLWQIPLGWIEKHVSKQFTEQSSIPTI